MEESIYEKAKKLMDPKDIDHHASDLYLRVNDISKKLIADSGLSVGKGLNVEIFKDQIDGDMWYDIFSAYPIKQEVKESKTLEDATLKLLKESVLSDMYDSLETTLKTDDKVDTSVVDGLVDDILIITDPDIDEDQYQEVIDRAQEVVEDTEEGDIPFDDEYVGQYAQTCPICGGTFVTETILEPGATCPICLDTPEAFVMVGQLAAEEDGR